MADPREMAERLLARQAQTFRQAGDQLVENTLGRYAKEALAAGEALSREGLKAWLHKGLSETPSAKGKLAAEQDAVRQLLEGALRFLEAAPPESSENN